MARIVVVEDDECIRDELIRLLCNSSYDALSLKTFDNASGDIMKLNPDLVLMDVNLPGTNGLNICDEIRKDSNVPIIFVTSNNTSMDELNCIMRGGDDYIAKPYQIPILFARISAVLRRTMNSEGANKNRLSYKGITLDVTRAEVEYNDKTVELTRNELKILYYLFDNRNEIVSRADLIDYLWDNEVFIDDNTLSVNVTRIRNKLEEIGITDLIETKRGMGYRI